MNTSYSNRPNETILFPQAELQYAGFWERFGAAFLDGIILSVVSTIVSLLFSNATYGSADFSVWEFGTSSLVNMVVQWLYYAFQESGTAQATLGKRALGLKVGRPDGSRISFMQATGRFFGRYLSMIILFIGYLMMIWDDRKQTLHDKMAGTIVFKSRA